MQVLSSDSADAVKWLHSFGLALDVVSQCGGHSLPRTHRLTPGPDGKVAPVGFSIVSKLSAHLATLPDVEIIKNASVSKLLTESIGKTNTGITGVEYSVGGGETQTLKADAVILCTGGFGANVEMLEKHAPRCRLLPTTNGDSADGSGMKLAEAAGAALVDMDQVQVHPTSFVDPAAPDARTKFLAPEALRGSGAILVNDKGKRFVDELGTRDKVTAAITSGDVLPRVNVHLVVNEAMVETFGRAAFDFYFKVKKFFVQVKGAAGLAAHLNASAEDVAATLMAYGNGQDEFGKTVFPGKFTTDEDLCTLFGLVT